MGKVRVFSNQHNAWWRACYNGYTTDIREAGVYDMESFKKDYPYINFNEFNEDYLVAVDPVTVILECIDLLGRDGINSKLIAKQKLIEVIPDLEELINNDR